MTDRHTLHASTRVLVAMILVTAVAAAAVGAVTRDPQAPTLLLPYEWHKVLHVLGAILFVGNIVVTAAWMVLAERTRDARVLSFASRAVSWADVLFTAPGVFLVLTNGLFLSTQWGGITRTSWLVAALALFTISGAVWTGMLLRYQHQLIALSAPSSLGMTGEVPPAFYRALHRWYAWGAVATVLPLLSLSLMVLKPSLW